MNPSKEYSNYLEKNEIYELNKVNIPSNDVNIVLGVKVNPMRSIIIMSNNSQEKVNLYTALKSSLSDELYKKLDEATDYQVEIDVNNKLFAMVDSIETNGISHFIMKEGAILPRIIINKEGKQDILFVEDPIDYGYLADLLKEAQ